jgi:hypothetical protein
MAGRGPARKPDGARARRNVDPHPHRELRLVRAPQPALPRGVKWCAQTRAWWKAWAKSELSRDFTADDWSFLLDTALMHNEMWSGGEVRLAGEIRLRVAKFGATPEDRQRLRLTLRDPAAIAAGAETEGSRAARTGQGVRQPSRKTDPRGVLRVV